MGTTTSVAGFKKNYNAEDNTYVVQLILPASLLEEGCKDSALAKTLTPEQIIRLILDAALLSYGLEIDA